MTIQKILLQYEPKKENLLRAIKQINAETGCFDTQAAEKVGKYFEMPAAAVYSAASFYDEINTKGKVPLVIEVCDGANCRTKGSDRLIERIEALFGIKVGDAHNRKVRLERTSCNGNCLAGPIMTINGTIFAKVQPEQVEELLKGYIG